LNKPLRVLSSVDRDPQLRAHRIGGECPTLHELAAVDAEILFAHAAHAARGFGIEAAWWSLAADGSFTRTKTAGTAANGASVSVGVSACELDLFGYVKNANAAALQTYLASAEDARATRLALVSEVATQWLALGPTRRRSVSTKPWWHSMVRAWR
jgi:outer membrane protein TolC